jgi:hypothetical protein
MAAPINDNFASAITLTGTYDSVAGTNIDATKEIGEPDLFNPGGSSVWYKWTCPFSGNYLLTTAGSDFDTILGVFTGSALNALTCVGSDDDSGPGLTSQFVLTASAGTTYYIMVDGYLYFMPPPLVSVGNIVLTITIVGASPSLVGLQDGTLGVLLSADDLATWSSSLVLYQALGGNLLPAEPGNYLSIILLPV